MFGPATPAQAAVTPGYESVGGSLGVRHGAPVRWGGAFVYPRLLMGMGRNSNVVGANADSQTTRFSASFASLQPEIDAQMGWRGDRYGLVYRGNYTRYTGYSSNPQGGDNFDNHSVEMYGDNVFSSRARLSWGVGYQRASDPRGATAGATALHSAPDRWASPTARAMFGYGAQGAVGRLELEASTQNKRYQNNLDDMAKLSLRSTNIAGRFYYRVMPKTRALVELRHTNIRYTSPGSGADDPSDGNELRYYAGLTWEATAATTGTVKFGRMRKTFADSRKQSALDSSWEANIRWAPLVRTYFDLSTTRALSDSTGLGSYALNSSYALAWTHNWSSKLNTKLSFSSLRTTFVGADRQDETRNIGLHMNYEMYRWLFLGLDHTATTRSSNVQGMDFRRNVTMFTVEGTL